VKKRSRLRFSQGLPHGSHEDVFSHWKSITTNTIWLVRRIHVVQPSNEHFGLSYSETKCSYWYLEKNVQDAFFLNGLHWWETVHISVRKEIKKMLWAILFRTIFFFSFCYLILSHSFIAFAPSDLADTDHHDAITWPHLLSPNGYEDQ